MRFARFAVVTTLFLCLSLQSYFGFAQRAPRAKAQGAAAAAPASSGPIKLLADLTDAPRKLVHAHLIIPASAGPLTLVYPKWIPGEHGPTGPIVDAAGLRISANGQEL